MSKKAKKTAARTAPKAGSRAVAKTATKRPASSLNGTTAERIATALEAIAGHLSAASPAAGTPESFGSADAFVWHPDGRLSPVPRVSRVDLGPLLEVDRAPDVAVAARVEEPGGVLQRCSLGEGQLHDRLVADT